jgi:hypothetical protein
VAERSQESNDLRRTLAAARAVLVDGGENESLVTAAKRVKGEVDMLALFLDQVGVPSAPTLLDRVRTFYNRSNDTLNAMREWFGEQPFIIDPRQEPFEAGWRAGVNTAATYGDEEARKNKRLPEMRFEDWKKEDDAERKAQKRETVNEALARIKSRP